MTKTIVYGTGMCVWCEKLKEFLKENKVEFEYKDVGQDSEAAKEMVDKSGQMGVPVTDIDGKIIIGFDEYKIRELLDIKNE